MINSDMKDYGLRLLPCKSFQLLGHPPWAKDFWFIIYESYEL